MTYYSWNDQVEFSTLKGKVCTKVEKIADEELHFYLEDGSKFVLRHDQNCCENVYIESIVGDLDDLVGSEILVAEEVTSDTNPEGVNIEYQDSFTWTFYKLATRKGYVDIRWYGESNGYYSESVDCYLIKG